MYYCTIDGVAAPNSKLLMLPLAWFWSVGSTVVRFPEGNANVSFCDAFDTHPPTHPATNRLLVYHRPAKVDGASRGRQ